MNIRPVNFLNFNTSFSRKKPIIESREPEYEYDCLTKCYIYPNITAKNDTDYENLTNKYGVNEKQNTNIPYSYFDSKYSYPDNN